MRAKIAAGNWKMNGTGADLSELEALCGQLPDNPPRVVICPPAPLLYRAVDAATPHGVAIGAQDCHAAPKGAFTGDISAAMIADTGASHVIVGHSERRDTHSETDADVRAKAVQAHDAGLIAIVCVGESADDRATEKTLDVIADQLAGSLPDGATADSTVVAYEPIWAIGTGKTPTLVQISAVHDFIRGKLIARYGAAAGNGFSLLYGGSVKADNAETIFSAPNVDGALVGGASLKASDFGPIVTALAAS